MAEQVSPEQSGGKVTWVDHLAKLVAILVPIKAVASITIKFVKRVALLPQAQEEHEIKNLQTYTDTASKILNDLEHRGVRKERIKELAETLYLPLVQATLDSMIIRRKFRSPEEAAAQREEGATQSEIAGAADPPIVEIPSEASPAAPAAADESTPDAPTSAP